MKLIFIAVLVLLNIDVAYSQSQYELTAQASKEFRKADSALNSVSNIILKNFRADEIFINSFKNQRKFGANFLMQK